MYKRPEDDNMLTNITFSTRLSLQNIVHWNNVTILTGFVELPDGKVLSGSEWGNMLLWDGGLIKVEISKKGKKPCHNGMIEQFFMDEGELMTIGADGFIKVDKFWDPPGNLSSLKILPYSAVSTACPLIFIGWGNCSFNCWKVLLAAMAWRREVLFSASYSIITPSLQSSIAFAYCLELFHFMWAAKSLSCTTCPAVKSHWELPCKLCQRSSSCSEAFSYGYTLSSLLNGLLWS